MTYYTTLLIGYREPAADENSALAQAYEYLLAGLEGHVVQFCTSYELVYYESSFMVQIYDYCMVY